MKTGTEENACHYGLRFPHSLYILPSRRILYLCLQSKRGEGIKFVRNCFISYKITHDSHTATLD